MSQSPLASPRWAPALGAMRTFSPIPFDPSLACHQLLEAKRSGESRKLQGSPPGLGGLPGTLLGARPRPPPPLWSPGPAVWGGPSAAHHLSSPVLAPSPPLQDPLTSRPGALGPGEDKSESPGGPPPRRHPREGRESTELPRAVGSGGRAAWPSRLPPHAPLPGSQQRRSAAQGGPRCRPPRSPGP